LAIPHPQEGGLRQGGKFSYCNQDTICSITSVVGRVTTTNICHKIMTPVSDEPLHSKYKTQHKVNQ